MFPHIDELTLSGPATLEHIDRRAFDGNAHDALPASYRAYIQKAGWARLFGLWLVFPPVETGFADGLRGRGAMLTERVRADYADSQSEGYDWTIAPDGTWELTQHLTVFGVSENGDYLLWGEVGSDGEMPVYVSSRGQNLKRIGLTLDDALPWLRAQTDGTSPELTPLVAVEL